MQITPRCAAHAAAAASTPARCPVVTSTIWGMRALIWSSRFQMMRQSCQSCGQETTTTGPCGSYRSRRRRSEEHTSELPSLMRISYAVFCLKKQTMYEQTSTYLQTTYTTTYRI